MDVASARRVMFSSYFYLMIVFLSLYANKEKKSTEVAAKMSSAVMVTMMNKIFNAQQLNKVEAIEFKG